MATAYPVSPFAKYTPEELRVMTEAQTLGYITPYIPGQPSAPSAETTTYWPDVAQQQLDLNRRQFDVDTAHMGWQEKEEVRQFDANLERLNKDADLAYKQAVEVARIYAGSNTADARSRVEQAKIAADAAVKAAQIAAAAAKYDANVRLQLGKEANAIEKSRIWSEEFGKPSQWASQAAFARGWQPAQAEALKTKPPGFLGEQQAGTPTASWLPSAPQAVVGEPDRYGRAQPELATATPQGTIMTPLGFNAPQVASYLKQLGVPGAQKGGLISEAGLYERRPSWGEEWRNRQGPKAPTVSTEPPEPPLRQQTSLDTLFQQMQGTNQAAFGTWTGPTNLPQVGLNENIRPPASYNLNEWRALPTAQRAMLAGTWRALGMIPGENEAEMLYYAEEAMRRSAWIGGGPAQVAYGAW